MPSCMRAPPDEMKKMKGVFFSTALRMAVMMASPAAMPSEPPMKAKSCTAIVTGKPSSSPTPAWMESSTPVLVRASLMRSAYLRSSRNFSGSAGTCGMAIFS